MIDGGKDQCSSRVRSEEDSAISEGGRGEEESVRGEVKLSIVA